MGQDCHHAVRRVWHPCLYSLLHEHGQGGPKLYHGLLQLILVSKVFANIFKWLYRNIFYCNMQRKHMKEYDVMENEMEEIDAIKQEEEVK